MSNTNEDAPATRLVNCVAQCFAIVVSLGSKLEWERFCETVAASERKPKIQGALCALVSAAPLLELPTVQAPKPMIRRLMAIAAELQRLVAAWDDDTEPPAELVSVARQFLDYMRDSEHHLDLP